MKKIFIALSLLLVFRCEDDLTNKTPVFQATVNGHNQWIAEDFIATIQNNQLSISGTNPFGVISFVVNSPEVSGYNFYSWTEDYAIFQDTLQYSTQNDGTGSIAFLSDGYLDIQEIDSVNNTISVDCGMLVGTLVTLCCVQLEVTTWSTLALNTTSISDDITLGDTKQILDNSNTIDELLC